MAVPEPTNATCESQTVDGIWSFTLDTSVVSYALGGEELNPKYNCFDYSKDGNALQKFRGIVKALATKLNRPGWAMNCVNRSPKGYSVGFFFDDEHFCRYDVVKGDKVYSLDIVKLDKSEPVPEE
ncbi:unnamed protein product [Haemonchus placei]|uniref:Lipocalin-like domain-containing protein n=1 Tax=Haemonchus placei TaxID=6290 RepID=A0A0N4X867_HAEPC|nr:unnamed protein product [Haemonchus placei]